MKLLVYTCVVGGYDRVFPPVKAEPGVDYVIVSDDASIEVEGWRTVAVDASDHATARAHNRRFKMLGHEILSGYDFSIYVDGNIRILGPLSPLVARFIDSGAALGVYPHPTRSKVAEEVSACVAARKSAFPEKLEAEYAEYVADGFPDIGGLVEGGILLKNHAHPALGNAMRLWWSLFERSGSRDQISLPYVIWKTNLSCHYELLSFREANPYFGLYPHAKGKDVPPLYALLSARAYDSKIHRCLLDCWHAKWMLQRRLRPQSRQRHR